MNEIKRRIKNIISAAIGKDILPVQDQNKATEQRYEIIEVKAFASRFCGREKGIRDGIWNYLKENACKNLAVALMEQGLIRFQREETAEKCTVRAYLLVSDNFSGWEKENNGQ